MKKIEAIIRAAKLNSVKDALRTYGIIGLEVTLATGCGKQRMYSQSYRSVQYPIDLIPRGKIEIVVKDSLVEEVIEVITNEARTGEIGDGKIFVSIMENAYSIITGNTGEQAI